jgi:hypothetical protein
LWNAGTRNAITFCLGAAGFIHELLFTAVERPFILTASLALMGFPFVLSAESKLKERRDE